MTIAFFDFDGTITSKDSLLQFIRFSKGNLQFYTGFILLLPVLFAYKFGIIPNWRAKELFFSYFFKGMNEEDLLKLGTEFSVQIIPGLIRPEAVHEFEFHKKSGNQVVVVTASFPIWIKPWCNLNQFELIATEYELKEARLTGLIQGKNCFGPEKVKRIKEKYDLSRFDQIYAYGDSPADIEMLILADVKYMKWKKIN